MVHHASNYLHFIPKKRNLVPKLNIAFYDMIKMLTVAKLKDQMLDHARYAKYLQEQIEEREATRKCIDQLVCFAFWEMIEERGMLPSQVVGRLREDMAKSYHRAVMPVQFWNVDGLNAFLRRVSDQRV